MRFSVRLLNTVFLAPVLSISYSFTAQAITFHGSTSAPDISAAHFSIDPPFPLNRAQNTGQNHPYTTRLEGIIQNLAINFSEFSDRDRLATYFEYRPQRATADTTLKLNLDDISTSESVPSPSNLPSFFANIDLTLQALAVAHPHHKATTSALSTEVAPGGSRNWIDAEESRHW